MHELRQKRFNKKRDAGNAIANSKSNTASVIFSACNSLLYVTLLWSLCVMVLKFCQPCDTFWFVECKGKKWFFLSMKQQKTLSASHLETNTLYWLIVSCQGIHSFFRQFSWMLVGCNVSLMTAYTLLYLTILFTTT